MPSRTLRLYHNDKHIVIASGPKDAMRVLLNCTGNPRDVEDEEAFVLLAGGSDRLSIYGRGYPKKTANEHIRAFGRKPGYLHSYEYPQG